MAASSRDICEPSGRHEAVLEIALDGKQGVARLVDEAPSHCEDPRTSELLRTPPT